MVRRRVLELVPWVQVLACIVVAPLVEVGCILAFVACILASWVVVVFFEEVACIAASWVVACTLEARVCIWVSVEVALVCIEALAVVEVVLAYIVVVASLEAVSSGVVAYKLDALVEEVLVCILA
jgi:hypothetical protein